MAIKGRLRFEILRRDNHTCRYCGATSEDEGVKLTVDHVVPESLGGTDEPSNLVTACMSCNAGKASIAPDSALVADVAADALRYGAALSAAIVERARNFGHLQDRVDEFDEAWSGWHFGDDESKRVPRSLDWRPTVERWILGGLDIQELISKIPIAMKRGTRGDEGRWTYFCGIAWQMLTDLQDRARDLAALETHHINATDGAGASAQLDDLTLIGWTCEECGSYDLPSHCEPCVHDLGFFAGRNSEQKWAWQQRNREFTLQVLQGAVLV